MKKILMMVYAFAFLFSAIFFCGCKKEDTTLPIISLNGTNPMLISLNASTVDPGASAKDDKDGDLVVTSDWNQTTTPDVNFAGTYYITYSASDKSSNKATATRIVVVRNDSWSLAGTYLTTEDTSTWSPSWTQTVTVSNSNNNRLIFSKFAYPTKNNQIYAVVFAGGQVDLSASQNGAGPAVCPATFAPDGSGMPVTNILGHTIFSIRFTDEELFDASDSISCPGGAPPVSMENFFKKQ